MATYTPLLPPMNRNFANIFDHNGYGLVAYGSRSNIYVFDFRVIPAIVLDDKVIRNSHRGKVFSISFCKLQDASFLASIGEDSVLRIWDLGTLSCIASTEVKEISRIVEWLYGSSTSIVYSEANGMIVKWNYRSNKIIKMKSSSEVTASALASNALSPEIIAVGHGSGAISIINIISQALLHTLRIHHMEVTSLSWSPLFADVLLSTSMDQSARVWKLGEEKPVKTYYFPSSRIKNDDKKNSKICSIFHPENPDVIICSNVRGDVGAVTFKGDAIPKFSSFGVKESDTFKSVVKIIPYYVDNGGTKKFTMLTCDHIKISLWDISEEKFIHAFYHQSGCLYDFACSTINPNLMAICSGDGIFRVWNLSSPSAKLDITSIPIHFRIKIMCAAWHPVEENLVAFATDEGRIGIIDIFKRRSLYSFESHHAKSVYGLQWGPCCKAKTKDATEDIKQFYLYSCGGGVILINELNKPKEKALDFETLIQLPPDLEKFENSISEVSWKSDYSCLAVGNYKGFVDLFNEELIFLSRFSIQMKNVESMKWHPICTFTSPAGSPFATWIAVSGNDENIHILDSNDAGPESSICRSSKTLAGHKKKISSVSWSQHMDGHLASASKDGTVQVWNVATATLIANYADHKDMVYAVQWSIIDSDVILSGGMDCCLRMWKISDQKASAPPQKSLITKYRKPLKKPKELKNIRESEITKSETPELNGDTHKDDDHLEEYAKDVSDASVCSKSNSGERYTRNKYQDSFQGQNRRVGNLFPYLNIKDYSKDKFFQDVFKLADILSEHSKCANSEDSILDMSANLHTEDINNLGIFMDQMSALKMIENLAKYNRDIERKDHAIYLGIMSHNIEPLLRDLAEKSQLTDFYVAAAPSVSYNFWIEMTEKFAVQLVEDQQYLKASMYFTLCGKFYEAVKMLAEKGRIVDALALAKARLPENDPVIENLFYKNAKCFSQHKCIEAEALCYLALKQPAQAAKILYCSSDSKYIWAATYICKKFNLKEESEMYANFCIAKCLSDNDWPTFYKMAEHMDNMKVYSTLVRVHELLQNQIKLLKKDGLVGNDIFGKNESKTLIWSGKTNEDTNIPFLTNAFNIIQSEGILSADEDSLQAIHQALLDMEEKRMKTQTATQAHICIAICVTQVIVLCAMGKFDDATSYFNRIFDSSFEVVFLPRVICWLFLPIDIYWHKDEGKFVGSLKSDELEVSPPIKNFNNWYRAFCSTIASVDFSNLKTDANNANIIEDLGNTIETVSSVLSEKKIGDSLLLYFLASYINELKRVSRKGWRFRCYENLLSSDVQNLTSLTSENAQSCEAKNFVPSTSETVQIKEVQSFKSSSFENIQSCEAKNYMLSNSETDQNTLQNYMSPTFERLQNPESKNFICSTSDTNSDKEIVLKAIEMAKAGDKSKLPEFETFQQKLYRCYRESPEVKFSPETLFESFEKYIQISNSPYKTKTLDNFSELFKDFLIYSNRLSQSKTKHDTTETSDICNGVIKGVKKDSNGLSLQFPEDSGEALTKNKITEHVHEVDHFESENVILFEDNNSPKKEINEFISNNVCSDKDMLQINFDNGDIEDVKENSKNPLLGFEESTSKETVTEHAMKNIVIDKTKYSLDYGKMYEDKMGDTKLCDNLKENSSSNTFQNGVSINMREENSENELLSSHETCWNDMNLLYVITKSFVSELCREEYALLHYLTHAFRKIDLDISNLVQKYLNINKADTFGPSDLNNILSFKENISLPEMQTSHNLTESILDCHTVEDSSNDKLNSEYLKKNKTSDKIAVQNEVASSIDEKLLISNTVTYNAGDSSRDVSSMLIKDDGVESLDSSLHNENNLLMQKALNLTQSDTVEASDPNIVHSEATSPDKKCDILEIMSSSTEKLHSNEPNGEFTNLTCDELFDLADAQTDLPVLSEFSFHTVIEKRAAVAIKKALDIHAKYAEYLEFLQSKFNYQILQPAKEISIDIAAAEERMSLLLGSHLQKDPPKLTTPTTICLVQKETTPPKKEFYYPNPFAVIGDVFGICIDIWRKNPCKVVKEKFHSLAHDVLKSCVKYSSFESSFRCCPICYTNFNDSIYS